MRTWGRASKKNRSSIDHRLNAVSDRVLVLRNHSIIKGHRGEAEQNAAFNATPQRSKLKWPDGKHNAIPSKALDMQPYPMPDDEDTLREDLSYLAGLYIGIGSTMGLTLRWGGDFDQDGETADNRWDDLWHIEIVE